jgi:hypothetical protein
MAHWSSSRTEVSADVEGRGAEEEEEEKADADEDEDEEATDEEDDEATEEEEEAEEEKVESEMGGFDMGVSSWSSSSLDESCFANPCRLRIASKETASGVSDLRSSFAWAKPCLL